MNIGIDIRSTLKRRTGIGNYTFALVNALADVDRENTYFLYSYIRPFDIKRKLWPLPGRNFNHRVDRLSFRPERAVRSADVFHTSSYDIPGSRDCCLFTTVHDIVPFFFPQGYSDDYLSELETTLKRVLKESKAVFVDSENTKNDIDKMFRGVSERIEVIYPGRDESIKALDKRGAHNVVKEMYGIGDSFLLYSGGMDPRKNITRLLNAFCELKRHRKIPQKLVVIGAKKSGCDAEKKVIELGIEKDVIFTGYVPGRDLNYFYSAADCFIYPSLYEGFGFPILEAFGAGTPVVTSSNSSCGELASDAALTIDPSDTGSLVDAIFKVITDNDLAMALKDRGKERAKDFSWENAARRVLELFRGN